VTHVTWKPRSLVEFEWYSSSVVYVIRTTTASCRCISALFVTCATFCEFIVFALVVHFREHLPGGHATRDLRWLALDVVRRDTCRAELPAVGHAFVRRTFIRAAWRIVVHGRRYRRSINVIVLGILNFN